MNDRRCTVCKLKALSFTPRASEGSYIYKNDKEIRVNLCVSCSVSLFKKGQKKFLLDNYKILSNQFIDNDESAFIEVLLECVHKNKDQLPRTPFSF